MQSFNTVATPNEEQDSDAVETNLENYQTT